MADNKVTDIEMSAILAAFAESREIKTNSIHQSKIFMALIIFCNIYVLTSLVIYYLFGSNIHASLDADFIVVFDGRATVMFWLVVSMNIAAYFNVGFKALCLISLVYTLNSTIDNAVIFSRLLDFDDNAYFSIFVISRPIMFVVLAWMGLIFRDSLEGN
jgi:hypothetical protein